MSFGNYLSRDWVTICRTSKWIFGHMQGCEKDDITEFLENIIISYHCAVGRIMGGGRPDSMRRHIKAFLTKVHNLDQSRGGFTHHNAVLVKKVHFLTLLNIPDATSPFGCSS